eukprot:scaffold4057_cov216-Skeletonema_marinoi.AAC.4
MALSACALLFSTTRFARGNHVRGDYYYISGGYQVFWIEVEEERSDFRYQMQFMCRARIISRGSGRYSGGMTVLGQMVTSSFIDTMQ